MMSIPRFTRRAQMCQTTSPPEQQVQNRRHEISFQYSSLLVNCAANSHFDEAVDRKKTASRAAPEGRVVVIHDADDVLMDRSLSVTSKLTRHPTWLQTWKEAGRAGLRTAFLCAAQG